MTISIPYVKSLAFPAAVYLIIGLLLVGMRFLPASAVFFEAVSIDLIISAPLFYLIAARKFKTRMLLVFPLIGFGFMLAKWLLPAETMAMQWLAKFLLPMLELTTVGSVSYYAYQFYWEAKRNADTDALAVIRKSCNHLFGKGVIAAALATEFAVVYYAFAPMKKAESENKFTSYRENNVLTLYGFIIFIILAETSVFHFLFMKWNVWIAWVVFGSSLYVALQIFAHARALVSRPVEIGEELKIRYGLAGEVMVPYDMIQNVILTGLPPSESEKPVAVGFLKLLEPHSVVIQLKEEVEVISFYGKKKRGRALLIPVDDKERFFELLSKKISTSK